jgi:predicted HAD superfamily Cof-like phosphohydrolase
MSLDAHTAAAALRDMLARLEEESTKKFLDECKMEAKGDVNLIMQILMPKIMEIQAHAMMKFGFQPSDEGFESFAMQLKQQESVSDEVKELGKQFKSRMQALTEVSKSGVAEKANMEGKSNAAAVREFTMGAGQPTPQTPSLMSKEEVSFIGKMILDEMLELFSTQFGSAEAKSILSGFLANAKELPLMPSATEADKLEQIAEQGDAFVDMWYYSLNAACKKGINLSSIFNLVHAANMAKRDPATGQFLKRADGKIIKPQGWTAPDVGAEIRRQMSEGAF